ncbi:pilus assembly protein PilY [Psychrobacter sp. Rd 27.2]|uniref:pilus assembly protein PilY n=1 Tax=Psychrobacter sp. Rd 27.2 TaxID=1926479 RepID=UPI000946C51C|nr:pilus assembly protein PilY [Psychrobacter sp. Rd 27.2]OLF40624.1 pilus assembly protein PilY [Psychrobacter sp. Rd 27.2]
MNRLGNTPARKTAFSVPLKYLVVAVASMMTLPAQADVAGKKIGDLEIYKAAEAGKTTITMMLDTSGSMAANVTKEACDLPRGVSYDGVSTETSSTTPSYIRRYCETERSYQFRKYTNKKGNEKWYTCDSGTDEADKDDCKKRISYVPSTDGLIQEKKGKNTYYYVDGGKYYDRLTRLKDAIFTLLDNSLLDPKRVSIGIGQYSTQSDDDNDYEGADGRTGKILVPAALVDDTQRHLIKTEIAKLIGYNGTPTANAYAEVGAYMLGTNPSRSSYSGYDDSVKSSKNSRGYISPLSSPSSCDGRGIYFLTDGNPNSSPNPNYVMQLALGASSFNIPSKTLPSGSEPNNSMPQVGAFAKALRDPTLNPLGTDREIYTAVVGFGSVFDVDKSDIVNLPYTNPKTGVTKNRDFYNCAKISDIDARNACNWGEKSHPSLPGVGGFGEGGFYSAQSTDDIVNSIVSFVTDLDNTLPSIPSGTIIVPDDPYRADSQLAVAYYPTLQPKVGDNSVIWEGNMKKYLLNEGTLYGKNNAKLFKSIAGDLEPTTQDMWSDKNYPGANDKVESGGFFAQLKTPATGVASVRTLYVEDWDNATNKKPVLRKVGVNASGKVVVDGAVLTNNTFKDTATYNEVTLRKILNFLGFTSLPSTATAVKDMTLSSANAPEAIKVLGATVHSTPAAVSYSANLDTTTGRVTGTRDDYVLFGSSEGGLHLVDADNYGVGDGGAEKFVIIPKEMLMDSSKSDALIKGATKPEIGAPNFGVDAPWLVTADYRYDLSNGQVNVETGSGKGVFAYGGLRMGGEAFYGVNLTNTNAPSMMFTITSATSGFSRMGQIWSKPTKAKIKTSITDTGTDVLVFGGGYDMCYENEGFQVGITDTELGDCSNKSSVKGNAVYIINAKTGDLIWSASGSGAPSTTVTSMKNSVVAGVTTLDRDNDGFMDHIYFADLGGQVFRADFTNAGFVKPVASGTASPETSFSNTRVTRVLKPAYSGSNKKYNHRFYERPVVSFYRNDLTNSLFALVNVISGDRSSPLSKIRDNDKADRLYGIIDSDITKADHVFYASNFTTAGTTNGQDIVELEANSTDLAELPSSIGNLTGAGYTLAQKNAVINTLRQGRKNGWYYPLTRFDGYGNVRYTKGVGKSEVVDSYLYTTVYNPDMSYNAVDSCSAKVTGGSERQLYCLPYGICTDEASKNGTAGYVQAGKGIQELTLGPRSSTLSNQRLLIGTRTLAERANDRVDFGSDSGKGLFNALTNPKGLNQGNLSVNDSIIGNGTAPELIFNERYTLQPKVWYEVD